MIKLSKTKEKIEALQAIETFKEFCKKYKGQSYIYCYDNNCPFANKKTIYDNSEMYYCEVKEIVQQ